MSDDTFDDDDDSVGYGRPPKETRWKKGQSGNPAGKRRRDESILEKLDRLVREEIPVTQNGSQTVMPADEAMLRAAIHKAMKGDMRALKLLFDHLRVTAGAAATVPDLIPTDADVEVMQTHADWLGLLERTRAERSQAERREPGAQDDAENDHGSF